MASPSVVGGIIDFAEKENIDLIVVGLKVGSQEIVTLVWRRT
jgi:hypothetical protein